MRSQDGARNPWSAPTTELWAPTAYGESANSASTTLAATTTTTTPKNRHELVHFSANLRGFLRHRSTDPPDQPDRHLKVVQTARCDGLINEYRNAA